MDKELLKLLMGNSRKTTTNKAQNMFIAPKKDTAIEAPHFQPYTKNALHQTDLLFLPSDNCFQYCLVVVDCGPEHICDAQPLREKNARAVLVGIKKIYNRHILEPPFDLTVDSGSEFKGEFKEGMAEMDIHLRTATSGRSNGLAYVENKNGVLGRLIHKYQLHQEIETGKVCRKWVSILPTIIKLINQHVVSHSKARPITDYPLGKIDFNTFKVGNKVHVALDKPIDYLTSKRLHGTTFRGSDIRWHPKIKVIREILLRPDTPMMYLVSDEDKPNHLDPIAYTRNKLQLI